MHTEISFFIVSINAVIIERKTSLTQKMFENIESAKYEKKLT